MDYQQIVKTYKQRLGQRNKQRQFNEQGKYSNLIEHRYFLSHLNAAAEMAEEMALETCKYPTLPSSEALREKVYSKAKKINERADQLIKLCEDGYAVYFDERVAMQIRCAHSIIQKVKAAPETEDERNAALKAALLLYEAGLPKGITDDDPVLDKVFDVLTDLKNAASRKQAPQPSQQSPGLEDEGWN